MQKSIEINIGCQLLRKQLPKQWAHTLTWKISILSMGWELSQVFQFSMSNLVLIAMRLENVELRRQRIFLLLISLSLMELNTTILQHQFMLIFNSIWLTTNSQSQLPLEIRQPRTTFQVFPFQKLILSWVQQLCTTTVNHQSLVFMILLFLTVVMLHPKVKLLCFVIQLVQTHTLVNLNIHWIQVVLTGQRNQHTQAWSSKSPTTISTSKETTQRLKATKVSS